MAAWPFYVPCRPAEQTLFEQCAPCSSYMLVTDMRLCPQDTLGSASDKADHHANQAQKEGQGYLDSAKDQANKMFGQGQVRHDPSPPSSRAAQPFPLLPSPSSIVCRIKHRGSVVVSRS